MHTNHIEYRPNIGEGRSSGFAGSEQIDFRRPKLLNLTKVFTFPEAGATRIQRWQPQVQAHARLAAMHVLQLHGTEHFIAEAGARGLTYVMRHSAVGLKWRSNLGECVELGAGSMYFHRHEAETLLEMTPSVYGQRCDCVHFDFQPEHVASNRRQLDQYDVPFCNSDEACVRVMLGAYQREYQEPTPEQSLRVLDIDVAPRSTLNVPLRHDRWGLAIVLTGSLHLEKRQLRPPSLLLFDGPEPLVKFSTDEGASVLWLDTPRRPNSMLLSTEIPSSFPSGSHLGFIS